jgi:hypothetical protein
MPVLVVAKFVPNAAKGGGAQSGGGILQTRLEKLRKELYGEDPELAAKLESEVGILKSELPIYQQDVNTLTRLDQALGAMISGRIDDDSVGVAQQLMMSLNDTTFASFIGPIVSPPAPAPVLGGPSPGIFGSAPPLRLPSVSDIRDAKDMVVSKKKSLIETIRDKTKEIAKKQVSISNANGLQGALTLAKLEARELRAKVGTDKGGKTKRELINKLKDAKDRLSKKRARRGGLDEAEEDRLRDTIRDLQDQIDRIDDESSDIGLFKAELTDADSDVRKATAAFDKVKERYDKLKELAEREQEEENNTKDDASDEYKRKTREINKAANAYISADNSNSSNKDKLFDELTALQIQLANMDKGKKSLSSKELKEERKRKIQKVTDKINKESLKKAIQTSAEAKDKYETSFSEYKTDLNTYFTVNIDDLTTVVEGKPIPTSEARAKEIANVQTSATKTEKALKDLEQAIKDEALLGGPTGPAGIDAAIAAASSAATASFIEMNTEIVHTTEILEFQKGLEKNAKLIVEEIYTGKFSCNHTDNNPFNQKDLYDLLAIYAAFDVLLKEYFDTGHEPIQVIAVGHGMYSFLKRYLDENDDDMQMLRRQIIHLFETHVTTEAEVDFINFFIKISNMDALEAWKIISENPDEYSDDIYRNAKYILNQRIFAVADSAYDPEEALEIANDDYKKKADNKIAKDSATLRMEHSRARIRDASLSPNDVLAEANYELSQYDSTKPVHTNIFVNITEQARIAGAKARLAAGNVSVDKVSEKCISKDLLIKTVSTLVDKLEGIDGKIIGNKKEIIGQVKNNDFKGVVTNLNEILKYTGGTPPTPGTNIRESYESKQLLDKYQLTTNYPAGPQGQSVFEYFNSPNGPVGDSLFEYHRCISEIITPPVLTGGAGLFGRTEPIPAAAQSVAATEADRAAILKADNLYSKISLIEALASAINDLDTARAASRSANNQEAKESALIRTITAAKNVAPVEVNAVFQTLFDAQTALNSARLELRTATAPNRAARDTAVSNAQRPYRQAIDAADTALAQAARADLQPEDRLIIYSALAAIRAIDSNINSNLAKTAAKVTAAAVKDAFVRTVGGNEFIRNKNSLEIRDAIQSYRSVPEFASNTFDALQQAIERTGQRGTPAELLEAVEAAVTNANIPLTFNITVNTAKTALDTARPAEAPPAVAEPAPEVASQIRGPAEIQAARAAPAAPPAPAAEPAPAPAPAAEPAPAAAEPAPAPAPAEPVVQAVPEPPADRRAQREAWNIPRLAAEPEAVLPPVEAVPLPVPPAEDPRNQAHFRRAQAARDARAAEAAQAAAATQAVSAAQAVADATRRALEAAPDQQIPGLVGTLGLADDVVAAGGAVVAAADRAVTEAADGAQRLADEVAAPPAAAPRIGRPPRLGGPNRRGVGDRVLVDPLLGTPPPAPAPAAPAAAPAGVPDDDASPAAAPAGVPDDDAPPPGRHSVLYGRLWERARAMSERQVAVPGYIEAQSEITAITLEAHDIQVSASKRAATAAEAAEHSARVVQLCIDIITRRNPPPRATTGTSRGGAKDYAADREAAAKATTASVDAARHMQRAQDCFHACTRVMSNLVELNERFTGHEFFNERAVTMLLEFARRSLEQIKLFNNETFKALILAIDSHEQAKKAARLVAEEPPTIETPEEAAANKKLLDAVLHVILGIASARLLESYKQENIKKLQKIIIPELRKTQPTYITTLDSQKLATLDYYRKKYTLQAITDYEVADPADADEPPKITPFSQRAEFYTDAKHVDEEINTLSRARSNLSEAKEVVFNYTRDIANTTNKDKKKVLEAKLVEAKRAQVNAESDVNLAIENVKQVKKAFIQPTNTASGVGLIQKGFNFVKKIPSGDIYVLLKEDASQEEIDKIFESPQPNTIVSIFSNKSAATSAVDELKITSDETLRTLFRVDGGSRHKTYRRKIAGKRKTPRRVKLEPVPGLPFTPKRNRTYRKSKNISAKRKTPRRRSS